MRCALLPLTLALLAAACSDHGHGDGARAHDGQGQAAGHGHAHRPVFGGTLVELGEEAHHLELLLDPASGRVDLWVLDGHAEGFVRIPAERVVLAIERGTEVFELTLEAVASALTGEERGDSSQFTGRDPRLEGAERFRGRIGSIEVQGLSYEDVAFDYPGEHE